MDNTTVRDDNYIKELAGHLMNAYDIRVDRIFPAKRGYYGETWKIESGGKRYFIKIDYITRHMKQFAGSLNAMKYLCDRGIDFIGKVICTINGELSSVFRTGVLGVFEWIEGENIETDATKQAEYQLLCRVYALSTPGLNIPTVRFTDDMAARFYGEWERLKQDAHSSAAEKTLTLLSGHGDMLDSYAKRLNKVAKACRADDDELYITHGDAGGNFFVGGGKNYILDWDEVMYATLERDAWVMCCRDWAQKLFNDTLRANGIRYQLRTERLAFYCYHMFFFYLSEFVADAAMSGKSRQIEEYFSEGWILERMRYADTISITPQ